MPSLGSLTQICNLGSMRYASFVVPGGRDHFAYFQVLDVQVLAPGSDSMGVHTLVWY